MHKFIKLAKGLDVLFKVLWWVMLVATIIAAVGLVVICVVPADTMAEQFSSTKVTDSKVFTYSLDKSDSAAQSAQLETYTATVVMDNISVNFEPDIQTNQMKTLNILQLVAALTVMLLSLLFLWQLKKITGCVKQGKQFSAEVCKRVRYLAYVIFASAIIPQTAATLFQYYNYKLTGLDSILTTSPSVISATFNFSFINGGTIVIGLVILLLSKVFEYGVELQNEHDTTL